MNTILIVLPNLKLLKVLSCIIIKAINQILFILPTEFRYKTGTNGEGALLPVTEHDMWFAHNLWKCFLSIHFWINCVLYVCKINIKEKFFFKNSSNRVNSFTSEHNTNFVLVFVHYLLEIQCWYCGIYQYEYPTCSLLNALLSKVIRMIQ